MINTPMGLQFTDYNDIVVNILSEIGLGVDMNQYLYDQTDGTILKYRDKLIKVSINGLPVYAGMNDIVYEPFKNYGISSTLFGLFIDRAQDTDDGDLLQGYIAHSLEDTKVNDISVQRVVVKTVGRGEIASNYFRNIFLAFAECIFRISGYTVDLRPFDFDVNAMEPQ